MRFPFVFFALVGVWFMSFPVAAAEFYPMPDVSQRCRDATCQVMVTTVVGGASGSGVCIATDGRSFYVLTNHHVAGDAQRIDCRFRWGAVYGMKRVATDPAADLCLLQGTAEQPLPWVPLAEDIPKVGDPVLQMGFPGELRGERAERTGTVDAWGKKDNGKWVMVCTLKPNGSRPGDSGSPCCFTKDGELCGLIWGGDGEDLATAVYLGDLRAFAAKHLGDQILTQCPGGLCPLRPRPAAPVAPGPGAPPAGVSVTIPAPASGSATPQLDIGPILQEVRTIAAAAGLPWWLQLLLAVGSSAATIMGLHYIPGNMLSILLSPKDQGGQAGTSLEAKVTTIVKDVLKDLVPPAKQV